MRWTTIWLTAVLIAVISAVDRTEVMVVDNTPAPLDVTTSDDPLEAITDDGYGCDTTEDCPSTTVKPSTGDDEEGCDTTEDCPSTTVKPTTGDDGEGCDTTEDCPSTIVKPTTGDDGEGCDTTEGCTSTSVKPTTGDDGEGCDTTEDCQSTTEKPTTGDNGEECDTTEDCPSTTEKPTTGDDGEGCDITEDCPSTTEKPTTGDDGEGCDTTEDCPSTTEKPTTGNDGEGCDTTEDCPSTTEKPTTGNDGEGCDTTEDCPSTTEKPTTGGDGDGCDDSTDECSSQEPTDEDLIIETNSGRVQGFLWQNKGNIISYIDIPYGTFNTTPFQAATAAEEWDIHSVRDHDKRCPQLQDNKPVGDRDCLTLSIFKPLKAQNASVLFYIHGDDFKTGSGDPSIYGPDYLVTSGIILVLPNYRLGPLGFLCMQNETAPGNIALKDLSLALSWIHDNIEAFGGDPDNIAVSGDGRSGALAELLALSPMSKDNVNKVISESGSLLSYWALDRDPKSTAAIFFDKIREVDESVESRIDISLEDLVLDVIVIAGNGTEFRPCLEADDDNAFMTATPYAMLKDKKIETTFLMGSAMYAGIHEALDHTNDSIKELNEDFTLLLPNDLKFSTLTLRAEVGGRVKTQYFGDDAITLDDVQDMSLYFTDVGYFSPGIRTARLLVEAGATVYFYEFSFVGKFNRELESLNHPVEGAVKGDIVGYLFTQDRLVPGAKQTDETKMIDRLTEMWTNFLKNGTPSTESVIWKKLESKNQDEEEWLSIDSRPCLAMQKGLHVDRLLLWTNIYREHFIDNHGQHLSPSVLTVLIFQLVFWMAFCRNFSNVL